ncbi:MAG: hypothetical protein LC135_09755 [Phycisphaerae bacterium]|nr:hypothetical protein [Phycisphaerae bacterium]MCZ2400134.1 hypothetical protein [Phycisphaerae bacterium]NUQ47312.1 hypothetical protein [Phycisphaerae bacterium]
MRDLSMQAPLASTGVSAPGHEYLVGRGVPAARLDTLIPLFDLRYDDDERRVVFPVRESGLDLGYAARAIDPFVRKRWLSHPVEGGHKSVIYEPDRVLAGGDTLFIVEGPFDAVMVTAAMQPGNDSIATAFFGSLPTDEQLAYVTAAIPLYRMVYVMLDANVYGRCRRLAEQLALAAGSPTVGSINIGIENRDPGATRFEELEALVEFASASWQTKIRWMWERRLVFAGGGKE